MIVAEQIFRGKVKFGKGAQTGGTRDVYKGEVDKSKDKVVFGQGARDGGVHNDCKCKKEALCI